MFVSVHSVHSHTIIVHSYIWYIDYMRARVCVCVQRVIHNLFTLFELARHSKDPHRRYSSITSLRARARASHKRRHCNGGGTRAPATAATAATYPAHDYAPLAVLLMLMMIGVCVCVCVVCVLCIVVRVFACLFTLFSVCACPAKIYVCGKEKPEHTDHIFSVNIFFVCCNLSTLRRL